MMRTFLEVSLYVVTRGNKSLVRERNVYICKEVYGYKFIAKENSKKEKR